MKNLFENIQESIDGIIFEYFEYCQKNEISDIQAIINLLNILKNISSRTEKVLLDITKQNTKH